MTLFEQLKAVYLEKRKARETDAVASLSTLIGEIETLAKAGRGETTDLVVVTMVKKFVKNNTDTAEAVLNGLPDGVQLIEAADAYHKIGLLNTERRLLESFLPKQLTEQELVAVIEGLIAGGCTNVGDAMKALKTDHGGRYDGAMASRILKVKFA